MFKELKIDDFRIFKDQTINIGKTLTAIAGQNATGKSTILSLLGNSCEIPASEGKSITSKRFRTEFSEIMKGSKKFDKTSGAIGQIVFQYPGSNDDYIIKLRVTWQKEMGSTEDSATTEKTRFRVIPKRLDINKQKYVESKLPIPSFYLGLSRLYPFGEADNFTECMLSLSPNETEWLCSNYSSILSLEQPINSISGYKIGKKYSGGINTDLYDFITNSSGQDNIMQFLYVLLSFKKLRENFKYENKPWNGGLIAIDEIDATLHPAAQIRLIDLLYNFSIENDLQIIFTTHSLQMLQYLSNKFKKKDDISITYLTTANNILQIKTNPGYDYMENDMLITNFYSQIGSRQIAIYSEDDEARWLIKRLLKDYITRIKLVEMKLGGDSLMDLLKNDPSYFKNVLFVLDGDKDIEKGAYKTLGYSYCNILVLPGKTSPEEMVYEYLCNLSPQHEILETYSNKGISLRYFKESNPMISERYKDLKEKREKYKRWFNDNLIMLEDINVFEFWKRDNAEIAQKFIDDFINHHNIVASRAGLPRLS